MTDRTSVCNQALALLGQRLISSIEEQTPTAEKCRAFYASTVKLVFEAYPWPFAKNRQALALDPAYTELAGCNAFTLPNPFCKIIAPKGDGYTQEGQRLLTKDATVQLLYTEEKPEGLWPAHFVKVVAAYLAGELAYPITESTTKSRQMYALYDDRLRRAKGQIGEVSRTDESEDLQAAHR